MAILKCKMCGGDIQATDNTFGTCESCGSTMTLPKANDDQKVNLFNRANNLRRQNEFDKAITVYESILNLDANSAEAHWGLVLSKYGIEYVEDPKTGQRVPTCRRVQSDSILSDADYLSALDNAEDEYTKSLYQEEAKQIAEIQKGILAISSKEEPYDVFICYKETTEGGTRTKDSTIAQDLYYELQENGYRVFFAKITLEDKLGREYEPYIFSALNSAKVMLVIGTCKEHFEAVWVKNEWSRYLAIMKKERSRLLIPCYRDMDAYDIPDELSNLQSQDMSKVGFVQDILRGLKKVLSGDESDTKTTGAAAQSFVGPSADSLMKRGWLFLEDSDWIQGLAYFESVLNINPEYAPAYIGKLCSELQVADETALFASGKPFTNNKNFQKAMRFADGDYKAKLEGYANTAKESGLKKRYDELVELKKNTSGYYAYLALAKRFRDMNGYEDTAELAAECENAAPEAREAEYNGLLQSKEKISSESGYQSLASQFRAMKDYKDSEALAKECEDKYLALKDNREGKVREENSAAEKAREERDREKIIAEEKDHFKKAVEEGNREEAARILVERKAREEKANTKINKGNKIKETLKNLMENRNARKIMLIIAALVLIAMYILLPSVRKAAGIILKILNLFY